MAAPTKAIKRDCTRKAQMTEAQARELDRLARESQMSVSDYIIKACRLVRVKEVGR